MSCRSPAALAALWLALLVASLLAGCGEKQEPDPATVPAPGPAAEVIGYVRSGGIAGITQRVEITATNEALVATGDEQPHDAGVAPGLVEQARDAVEAIDFADTEVPTQPPAPDGFEASIRLGTQSVAGAEDAMRTVPKLDAALDALDAILAEATATKPQASGSRP